jgi:hypothetical protein
MASVGPIRQAVTEIAVPNLAAESIIARDEGAGLSNEPTKRKRDEEGPTLPMINAFLKQARKAVEDKDDSRDNWLGNLRSLDSGKWLKQPLPLRKFLAEKKGEKRRKVVRFEGTDVEIAEAKKKREVNSWAVWTLANINVLGVCPNETLLRQYVEYIRRGLELHDEGHRWEDFDRMDEAFRFERMRLGDRWDTFYPYLAVKLIPKPLYISSLQTSDKSRASGDSWCKHYNRPGGCSALGCTFAHKCSLCTLEGHSKLNCPSRLKSN